jgi:hypothetical protein
MMRKWGILAIAFGLLFTACKNDDDNDELPQEEQNQVDDDAIVEYLENHYFDSERGVIKAFDEEDEEDDDNPDLKSLGTKLSSGVWVVKRPEVVAEGESADNNEEDSILISYNAQVFKATYTDLEEGEKPYSGIATFDSTINGTGTPKWDPFFYHVNLTDAQTENGITMSQYVIEGFTEGLKEFNSTGTNGSDLYNFQGAIIIPSRMAYGRDFDYINGQLGYNYRDCSFVFNFELHKVVPRNND